MPSFDAVSKPDWTELKNALDQAQREVAQRYDFKDTGVGIEQTEAGIMVSATTEERAKAAVDVLQQKMIRRKVSLRFLDVGEPTEGGKGQSRILIKVKEGIEIEQAREIVKLVKDSKLKVQASIQEKAVRISGKKKDDLQDAIKLLRGKDLGIEIAFVNFRD